MGLKDWKYVGGKFGYLKGQRVSGMIEMQNIYPWILVLTGLKLNMIRTSALKIWSLAFVWNF